MNKTIKVNGRDIEIFFEPENQVDRFVSEVIEHKEYQYAFEHKTVIDVGANIGTFSLYAYDYADIIYAIEPLKANYDNLVRTIKANHLDKIKPFHLAISDKTKDTFIEATSTWAGSRLADSGEPVKAVSLAQFIRDNNIDYVDVLKMDLEGHESTVLHAPDFIEVNDKINTIIYEHNAGDQAFFDTLGFKFFTRDRYLLKKV